ncbi:hypothetical protein ACIQVA_39535 [Streptomyces microflavus]|uniref:hypothetical protein n=1 Tax=Streptomyces microflavus TaxID=1919 RepID=UPI00381D9733
MRVDVSPGVDLLLAIGAAQPELPLTGKTLRDQGLMATGLLEAGWPVPLLSEVIARPLRRTVGTVISGRLKAAASMPVPGSAAGTAAAVPTSRVWT